MKDDSASQQFVQIVQETGLRDDTVWRPQNTFLRTCSVCGEMMPHYRHADCVECSVCGLKTYPFERGGILLEFLLWLALIVFVLLVVLKDAPW